MSKPFEAKATRERRRGKERERREERTDEKS